MSLSFGNMTVELNIFHYSFQPPIMDDYEEVSIIVISVSHMFEQSCYDDPLGKCLTHFGHNFDIKESIDAVNALLDYVHVMKTNQWKAKVEPLPVSIYVHVPLIIVLSKLELKHLPDTLKYVFLDDSEFLHVSFFLI